MPRRQVDAAVAVARAHGLPDPRPTVLSDGANTLVHLPPYDVVAKVSALTHRLREPHAWLARELDLAVRLGQAGVRVIVPSPELPAQVHSHDGLALTFWRHLPHDPSATPSPQQAGRLLADLHVALAGLVVDLPLLAPLGDVPAYLAAAPHPALRTAYDDLRAQPYGPVQALHGDPHPGNLLLAGDGWTWCDLEDCCSGPRAWDLAAMHESSRLDGPAAVRAAAPDVDPSELACMSALRRLHLTCWYQLYAETRPELRSMADRLLAGW